MFVRKVRFEFESTINLEDVEKTLHLAMFAVEGEFGRSRVRLETEYTLDQELSALEVDTSSEVGAMLVRIFTGLLIREFGESLFQMERICLPLDPLAC